jgi:CCR4-NOT transcription complex subunit 2
VNAIVQQNQEFSIQNEDFPALPGYKGVCSQRSIDLIMHVTYNSFCCV